MNPPRLIEQLAEFSKTNSLGGKGPLSVALVVVRHAKDRGLPLDADQLLIKSGGQVR